MTEPPRGQSSGPSSFGAVLRGFGSFRSVRAISVGVIDVPVAARTTARRHVINDSAILSRGPICTDQLIALRAIRAIRSAPLSTSTIPVLADSLVELACAASTATFTPRACPRRTVTSRLRHVVTITHEIALGHKLRLPCGLARVRIHVSRDLTTRPRDSLRLHVCDCRYSVHDHAVMVRIAVACRNMGSSRPLIAVLLRKRMMWESSTILVHCCATSSTGEPIRRMTVL